MTEQKRRGRLEGKVVFISGAGSGIGRAAALLFALEGATLGLADIAETAGEDTLAQLKALGAAAKFVTADITHGDSIASAIDATAAAFGRLDVLYNNAGGSTRRDGSVTEVSEEELRSALEFNVLGTYHACRAGIPHLVKCGGGSVINMASYTALIGVRDKFAYTASKGAVVAMTRSIAVDYAASNVRANAIAPCATLTPRVVKLMEDVPAVKERNQRHLLGLAQPEDIARAALYLACDDSRMTTGQTLAVDSGISIS